MICLNICKFVKQNREAQMTLLERQLCTLCDKGGPRMQLGCVYEILGIIFEPQNNFRKSRKQLSIRTKLNCIILGARNEKQSDQFILSVRSELVFEFTRRWGGSVNSHFIRTTKKTSKEIKRTFLKFRKKFGKAFLKLRRSVGLKRIRTRSFWKSRRKGVAGSPWSGFLVFMGRRDWKFCEI